MEKTVERVVMPCSDHLEFCSTRHAAEMIGVSHRTIHLWVSKGTLQAWRTAGGHRRISLASVNAILGKRHMEVIAPPVTPASSTRKVLILDEDPATARLYESELSSWGMSVQLLKATNAFDALIKIGENKPDMLISDLNMRGMDGFYMIRALRRNPEYSSMGIIVISGMDSSTVASMLLPPDIPVLSKPASFSRLRGLLEAVFQPA
jgi:excisionase family DNA binding protein